MTALVCLFVCLSTTLCKKVINGFRQNFLEVSGAWGRYKEQSIRFWKLSVEWRPLPTFKGKITPNILRTTHHILKILPEMHRGPRKSPLHC